MNNNKNGDTPANPIFLQEGLSDNCWVDTGLTKREYFAAIVMQGIMSNHALANLEFNPKKSLRDPILVEYAIRIADELLNQLDNEQH